MPASPKVFIDKSDISAAVADLTSAQGAIVAFAGGGQANGFALTRSSNRVATVATAGDSVRLPLAVPGGQITVFNKAASNSLNVFPATGDAINALAANAAYALAVTKGVTFFCVTTGIWDTIFTA